MKPRDHILLTAPLAGAVAWQAGLVPVALFYGGAILIDLDHFIFYNRRTGRFNPLEMFAWYEKADTFCTPSSYYGVSIFHLAEFFILLSLASPLYPPISWVLLGMGFHLMLDYCWLYRHPVLSVKIRPLSLAEHLVRRCRGEREFWRDIKII